MSGRRGAEGWLGGRAVSVRRRRRRVLYLEVLSAVHLLAEGEVGDALEDVLLRARRLDVLHQLERLLHLVVVHVVDHQVEPRLGHHPHQRRQQLERAVEGMWGQNNCARIAPNCARNCAELRACLQRALAVREDDHVVADEGRLHLLGRRRVLRQRRELGLRRLAVVQLELVARLQVERDRRVGVRLQVRRERARRQRIAQQNCTGLRRIARQLRACRYAARISRLTS